MMAAASACAAPFDKEHGMNSITMPANGNNGNSDVSSEIGSGLSRRIRHLLAWQFGVDAETIEMETGLVDQLYADSLDLMEMTHIMNREFDIDIEPEQLADMHTVGGIERVVAAMLRASEAATAEN
jgi:acyl carrier protein